MIKVDWTVIAGQGLTEAEKAVRKEPAKAPETADRVHISEDGKRKHILSQIQARISGKGQLKGC